MYTLKHSSYNISGIEDIIDTLSGYSHIDVEQTLLTNFMDQIADYKLDREADEEEPPTEEEQLDHLEINIPIGELTYSVLKMIEDCPYQFLLDEDHEYRCRLHIIENRPTSKEEFLKYLVDNIKEFPLTQEELAEAIFLKNI
jgi:hypothetical protein